MYELFYLLIAALMGFLLYRSIKNNPELYSSENLNKSSMTLAYLALFLMVFIGVCALILRGM